MLQLSYQTKKTLFLVSLIIVGSIILTIKFEKISFHYHQEITQQKFDIAPDKLTSNERDSLNYFYSLNKSDYSNTYTKVIDTIRPILFNEYGTKIGLYLLTHMYNSHELTPEQELYVLKRIIAIQQLSHDDISAIKTLFTYINLAKQVKNKYYLYYGKLYFAIIANNLGNTDKSTALTNYVLAHSKASDENWQQIIYDAYLIKSENEIAKKEYQHALATLEHITRKNKYLNDNISDDFFALKLVQQAEIYFYLHQEKKGLLLLNQAKKIINNNHKIFILDLVPIYKSVKLLYKKDDSISAENSIEKIGTLVSSLNYRYMMLNYQHRLGTLYRDQQFNDYNKLNDLFISELKKRNKLSYELFSLNDKLTTNNSLMTMQLKTYTKYTIAFSLVVCILILLMVILIKMINHLKAIENIDGLTLINNRRKFDIIYAKKLNSNALLCIYDIDDFKKINDSFGHDFGDTVLKKVTETMVTHIGKEYLFRIGGEEFAIIIKNTLENRNKINQLPKIIQNINWEHNIKITVSAGCTSFNTHNPYKTADELLYKSKKSGKNKILFTH